MIPLFSEMQAQASNEIWTLVGALATGLITAIGYIIRRHGGKVMDAAADNIKRGSDARLSQIQAELNAATSAQNLHAQSLKAVVEGQKEMFGLMRGRDEQLAKMYADGVGGMLSRMDGFSEHLNLLRKEVESNRTVLKEIQSEGMLRQQELFSEVIVSVQAVMAALNELTRKIK